MSQTPVYLAWIDVLFGLVIAGLLEVLRRLRKELRVAERASNEKAKFLANISREILSPMTGIIGMTNLLLETRLNDEQRSCAEIVRNSSNALLEMLNNAITFTRLAEGPVRLEQVDFDLHSLLEEAVVHFAHEAIRNGVEIVTVIPPDVPHVVCGDPVALQQALKALISNSVKFTAEGEISLGVKLVSLEPDGVVLTFDVIDTGIGIDEAERKNVLAAFSPTAPLNGTGAHLGLPICRKLVSAAGGSLHFHSVAGVGSSFWIVMKFSHSGIDVRGLPMEAALAGKSVRVEVRSGVLQRSLCNYCLGMGMRVEVESRNPVDLVVVESDRARGIGLAIRTGDGSPSGVDYIPKPVVQSELSRALLAALANVARREGMLPRGAATPDELPR